MSKGLAFVWAPKQHVSELLAVMDRKEFTYVENFEIINLDIEKAKEYSTSSLRHLRRGCANEEKREEPTQNEDIDFTLLLKSLEHANPCDLIADQASDYFNSSKRTLLMFKKVMIRLLRTAALSLNYGISVHATSYSTCRWSWGKNVTRIWRPIFTIWSKRCFQTACQLFNEVDMSLSSKWWSYGLIKTTIVEDG